MSLLLIEFSAVSFNLHFLQVVLYLPILFFLIYIHQVMSEDVFGGDLLLKKSKAKASDTGGGASDEAGNDLANFDAFLSYFGEIS